MKFAFPALLAAAALAASPFAATKAPAQDVEGFSSLEERMTGKEFTEAGLDKLTPEELAALNRWIRQRSVADYRYEGPAEGAESDGPVPIDRMPNERIDSRIVGTFEGWTGDTEFVLENGMVWEQTGNDRYRMRVMENPEVTIRPGLLGGWELQVEGYNVRTKVRRIR